MCDSCCCGGSGDSRESESNLWRGAFVELRVQLRQMLYEKGVPSNPAVDDQWIIDELRKLLGIDDSPHRFLNFPT